MFGRHLDQLLMCSVFGVSKITGGELKFRDIILGYRQLPQFQERVFREIPDDPAAEHAHVYGNGSGSAGARPGCTDSDASDEDDVMDGRPGKRVRLADGRAARSWPRLDIIAFYNRHFLPRCKHAIYALRLPDPANTNFINNSNENAKVNGSESTPVSPFRAPRPRGLIGSPRRVSATHGIFVSPWKRDPSSLGTHPVSAVSPAKRQWLFQQQANILTPMTKRLFSHDSSQVSESFGRKYT